MPPTHGFEHLREQDIPELRTKAALFRHVRTGAQLLSLMNEDENKVFGITFRTPPADSTGTPHILEHSVLCGSRKYPLKEPFVELLKGSLQTFLNAMTYPDKTCYPVASQNLRDFYNLVDVYLDAVFHPRLTPHIFQQEGWHYELREAADPLAYKGVVFNEMKGAYASPDALLAEYSQRSLFPDNTYGFDAGGDPRHIPELTFDRFKAFHRRYYHPSNARIYFYGDDDPVERLALLNDYLQAFEGLDIDSAIPLQPPFEGPRRVTRAFAVGEDARQDGKGMLTLNWLLPEATRPERNLAFHMLEYILLGMPGSPLRKALIDSNYGEDIAGLGLGSELRQMYFSTGLKGIDPAKAADVESLILRTLRDLAQGGIDPRTIEAALNTTEFTLRENNTGSYPRGLVLMLRSLVTWLYDEDPLALVAFEGLLRTLKAQMQANRTFFEDMLRRYFLDNPHRTTLLLTPDPDLSRREAASEKDRLARARASMAPAELDRVLETTRKLRQLQEAPDPPEALAAIPSLSLADLDRENKTIPLSLSEPGGSTLLYHDLFTSGILYLDLGLDLHGLPPELLPYAGLFGRVLLEMGTAKEDYVTLSQRISRKTGGIHPALFTTSVRGAGAGAARLFLRGKAMTSGVEALLNILRDVLLTVQLDNRERFRQMVLEAKARHEQMLVPAGHQVINLRLRACFDEADWAAEETRGVSQLLFLRELSRRVEADWPAVLTDLREVHRILVNRRAMVLNVTLDEAAWSRLQDRVGAFVEALPAARPEVSSWEGKAAGESEALSIPAQVNYVGKGMRLGPQDRPFHGSVQVISRFLRNAWLWDRVRVQGGAYGAFCFFDRLSNTLTFVSYRDPNILKTIEAFDGSAPFLRGLQLSDAELTKAVIGAIGDMDRYRLPDAKGYVSVARWLSGETDAERQRIREEVLGTTAADFRSFAEVLEQARGGGLVKVLGSRSTIQEAFGEREGLKVTALL